MHTFQLKLKEIKKNKEMEQRRLQTHYEGLETIKSKDDGSATKDNMGREIG